MALSRPLWTRGAGSKTKNPFKPQHIDCKIGSFMLFPDDLQGHQLPHWIPWPVGQLTSCSARGSGPRLKSQFVSTEIRVDDIDFLWLQSILLMYSWAQTPSVLRSRHDDWLHTDRGPAITTFGSPPFCSPPTSSLLSHMCSVPASTKWPFAKNGVCSTSTAAGIARIVGQWSAA